MASIRFEAKGKRGDRSRILITLLVIAGFFTVSLLQVSSSAGLALVQQDTDNPRVLQEQADDLRNDEDSGSDLAVTVSFDDIFRLILFLAASWLGSNLCECVGLPGLVGEIATGFLLGPPLADFCPYPEAMVLLGSYGLIGLILESGIHLDVGQLKESGLRAAMLAVAGTVLALGSGLMLGNFSAEGGFASAMAVGAAFAPSSLGVAANVLAAGHVLNTPIGHMIVASSVVDDVLGLILLSILQVFVKEGPTAFDFVLPFISSFGYLIVLGYLGITWIPRVIEKKILPLIATPKQDLAVFCIMFILLLIYIPALNYSGASYLTGAFLAGLSVSQIPSVHPMYDRNGREIMVWLMRIFFAATIGFQVPIKRFGSLYVLRWGAKFLFPVLAKLPLAFLVPRFRKDLPDDFPYDPFWRDVLVVALSTVCRGEFNFLIAAFGLSEGLLDADLYTAVVLAILVSSVVAPLCLSRVIRHYNSLSEAYMSANHPVQQIGNTCDGYRPLFLAIQARTPIHWGLQETFKKTLEEAGLILIDHRSFHTSGQHPIDITEIFAQDTVTKVRVKGCFPREQNDSTNTESDITPNASSGSSNNEEEEINAVQTVEDGVSEADIIQKRLEEIRVVLVGCLLSDDPADYEVQVSQWEPHSFPEKDQANNTYCLQKPHEPDTGNQNTPSPRSRHNSRGSHSSSANMATLLSELFPDPASVHHEVPHLSECDLWERDTRCQEELRSSCILHPTVGGHVYTESPEPQHHPLQSNEDSCGHIMEPKPIGTEIADHLHGYVRH